MKRITIYAQAGLALLVIIFFIIVLKRLMNSPAGMSLRQTVTAETTQIATENAAKIQQQKDRAVWMRWKSEELKARLNAEKAIQAIKNLPGKAQRWAAFWWGAVVSSILFMGLTALLVSVAVYKMARSNSDAVAMMLMLRGRSREELLAAREETKLAIAQLKFAAQNPAMIIDAQEPLAIDVVSTPTASECLDMGLISQHDGRFLWGFNAEGQPYHMTLKKDGFKAAIIGKTNQGKTYKMVSKAVQCFYKGYQGIVFDLHWQADRSLYQYMKPFTGRESIYWCTERDDINATLVHIEAELNRRLQGGSCVPLLIVVDDALAIGNSQEYADAFNQSIVRAVTEGPKVKISVVVASHNWQADSMPKQFRSNFDYRCAFRSEASESHLLFQDKKSKYANLTPDLQPGHCVLLDHTNDVHTLHGPMWDTAAIQRMADSAIEVPAVLNREEHEEIYDMPIMFPRLHVVGK